MKNLFFEFYTEEIPPFELYLAVSSIEGFIENFATKHNIKMESGKMFSTPRRIAYLTKAEEKQSDRKEIIWGPYKHIAFDANGNPTKALESILKSKNKKQEDILYKKDEKGEKIYFEEDVKGKHITELLPELMETILTKIPFKKSMKWVNYTYTFTRPIHNISLMFDNKVVPFKYHNLETNDLTYGHLILNHDEIKLENVEKYEEYLLNKQVIASAEKREEKILNDIKLLEEKHNFKVIIDEDLLKEVVNIVEFPNPFVGTFDEKYLVLPKELLISTMKKNQKYFYVNDLSGNLLNYFIGVANIPMDKDEAIIKGNQRVIRARFEDARFFFEEDIKTGLTPLIPKLGDVLFQKQLGTYKDKVDRIKKIALKLNKQLNFNIDEQLINDGADLIKVDLLTGMVGEFPELQGIAGFYFANKLGINKDIALSIKEHYLPKTMTDEMPSIPLSLLLSISDKLDTLVGGFIAGMEPTGSKDAFGLRRIALSLLKIFTENNYTLSLDEYFDIAIECFTVKQSPKDNLILFFKERLKYFLRNNYDSDIVDAVMFKSNVINSITINLCEAVKEFKNNENFNNLVFLMKRIENILKDDLTKLTGEINSELLSLPEEIALCQWIDNNKANYKQLIIKKEFVNALTLAIDSFQTLDTFFLKVLVNDKDENIRKNRQLLLITLYNVINEIASLNQLNTTRKQ